MVKKRKYSIETKMAVIEDKMSGLPMYQILEKYKIKNRTQVNTWVTWFKNLESHRLNQSIGKQYSYNKGLNELSDIERLKLENKRLQEEVKVLKELSKDIKTTRICEIIGISRATYYRKIKANKHNLTNIEVLIRDLCIKYKFRYGYRKIHSQVIKEAKCGVNKVRRVMRKYGWNCQVRPKKMNRPKNPFQLFDNLVSNKWKVEQPRKLLTTDITYLPFGNSTQYLCSIIDAYNDEVIAYQISDKPDTKLCVSTLEQLTDLSSECILHSDQGSTFASEKYFEVARKKSIIRSMSRKGTPSDNAIIESFHSSLKSETFYMLESKKLSNDIVREIVENYIYEWNHTRILTKLGNLSPIEYRKQVA